MYTYMYTHGVYITLKSKVVLDLLLMSCYTGHCKYGEDLANELTSSLHNVLPTCGSVRISFSRRTPKMVGCLSCFNFSIFHVLIVVNAATNRYQIS